MEKQELVSRQKEVNFGLDRIETFIANWHAFAEGRLDDIVDNPLLNVNKAASTRTPRKRATGNSKKEDVAEEARKIIEERGEPVSRTDLYKALISRGYTIEGTDPEMVLSTMLWRMKDRVVSLKGGGYWLTEKTI